MHVHSMRIPLLLLVSTLSLLGAPVAQAACGGSITSMQVIDPPNDAYAHVEVGYSLVGGGGGGISIVRHSDANGEDVFVGTANVSGTGTFTGLSRLTCLVPGSYTFKATLAPSCDPPVSPEEKTVTKTYDDRPTVGGSITALDTELSRMTVAIDYAFPHVAENSNVRHLFVNIDGAQAWDGWLLEGDSWHGSKTITIGIGCLGSGKHTVTFGGTVSSCGPFVGCVCLYNRPNEPAAFTIQQAKVTSFSVEPVGDGRTLHATVGYAFECTPNDQRGVTITFGQAHYGVPVTGSSGTGSVDIELQSCLPPGTYTMTAKAVSCNRPDDPRFTDEKPATLTTPGLMGGITLTGLYDPVEGKIKLTGSHSLPPGLPSARRVIRRLPYTGDDWQIVEGRIIDERDVTPSDPLTFDFPDSPPLVAQKIPYEATLTFCYGIAKQSTLVDCPTCAYPPKASGNPVSFDDGNTLVSDYDPLPPLLDSVSVGRAYNSHHRVRGLFGLGWQSMFDNRLLITASTEGDTLAVTSYSGESAIFFRRNGVYTQLWPKGHTSLGTLSLEAATSLYVYRPAGATTVQLFRSSDGRFAGYRQLGTGRELQIAYDADGFPQTVKDSWTEVTWTVTVNPTTKRINAIESAGLTWQYQYTGDKLTTVLAPGSSLWRTYEYTNDRMTASHDAHGDLIESHAYDANGRAIDSTGAQDEIQSIQYNAAGSSSSQLVTRVTMKSGAVSEFTLQPIGGMWRTVKITGGCSSCGVHDGAYAYDQDGHLTREQNASGYITVHTYENQRLASVQEHLKPAGCDPETSTTHCMLEPAALATAALDTTNATITRSYEYADASWPDKPTSIVRAPINGREEPRREQFIYHPLTGEVMVHSIVGWTENERTPTTQVTLYGDPDQSGDDGPPIDSYTPAFDPGGMFQSAWMSLPQPRLRKSVDGPRVDVTDVASYVYYPVHSSVTPATLRGRLAAIRNAAGHITRFESYDAFGNATRIVDPNGVATEMTFDALGRMLTSTIKGVAGCDTTADPLCATDLTTARTYSPAAGPLASEQRPLGGLTTYDYDDRGRVSKVSRGPSATDLRERIETTYDPLSGKKSLERRLAYENGAWVEKARESYAYDTFGELQTITHPDGKFISYAYDQEHRIAEIRDENHTASNTLYSYDPAGRLAIVKQTLTGAPGGFITTRYGYDPDGNLTSVTDPNGNVTTYAFDDLGRMMSQTSPVTATTHYTYDEAGDLLRTIDANQAITERTYDALGRVQSAVSTRAGNSESVTWTYDTGTFGVGRLATMADPTGSTSYRYERRGLLAGETKTIEGNAYITAFTYDADGNRASIRYPSSRIVNYGFDYAGRPSSVSTGAMTIVSSATYLPFGPAAEIAFGNGTTRRMQYDTRYRLQRNELAGPAGTIAAYDYGFDSVGNITSMHDAVSASYNRDFGYDDLNRLTVANGGSALWGAGPYAYDRMGNLLSSTLGTWRSSAFTYDGTTPKLSTAIENSVSTSVQYDAAGNELNADSGIAVYSPRNHLLNAGAYTYMYDGRGIRTVTRYDEIRALAVSIAPFLIGGGEAATGTVTLTAPAPAGGVTVFLASSNAALIVPASVNVAAGAATATFPVQTTGVGSSLSVEVTATFISRTATTAVLAPSCMLSGVSASPTSVTGGASMTGTVYLLEPAASGGVSVQLSTNNAAATVPATVTIPAGATSASFTITTAPSAASTNVTLTARLCGSISTQLTVVPPTIANISVLPASVPSGTFVMATVDLTGVTASSGVVVTTSSSDTTVATVPANVTVPAGQSSTTFVVNTIPRETTTTVVISAADAITTRSATLTVERCAPAASAPSFASGEVVWFDDALPAGAVPYGNWSWDTEQKASGTQSAVAPSTAAAGVDAWFENATERMVPGAGDKLFAYVLVDPCNPPREIMIGWYDGSWEHRAYWGEDILQYNTPGTGRIRFGDIPAGGQWIRLEVPAATFGLEGKSIHGLSLSAYGGRAWFDRVGRRSCATVTATPPSSFPAGEIVWYDDAPPPGSTLSGTWTWDTTQHASGSQSMVSIAAPAAAANHWFDFTSTPITASAGDTLFVYAYVDPCNPPREIMVGWSAEGDFEHRAFWGEDIMPYATPGTGRFNMGWLPRGGGWVKLEVPATLAKLDGKTITGMVFSVYEGRVWFDRAGKTSCAMPPPAAPALPQDETVWIEDALPPGGTLYGTWNWSTSQKASGTQSMVASAAPDAGGVDFWFQDTSVPMTTGAHDNLFVYVLVDPCAPPREIMIGWYDGSWAHRAYWGEDIFPYEQPGVGRFGFGPMPEAGKWVRLEVPAAMMNLANKSITGMVFSVYGGRAWIDRAGKRSCATPVAPAPSLSPSEVVWFDDATPAGAVVRGTWDWDTAQKASGTAANTAPAAQMGEDHWFDGATETMTVNGGENVFVYALIDPCDPPREIMIGWYDGSWEHRAYWGENLFPYGTPPTGRFAMGPIPQAGQWVRLEIPATIANLAGKTVSGLSLSVYGGKVWFDRVGKYSCTTTVAPAPTTSPEERVWFDDELPDGVLYYGTWQWDTTQKASGTRSHTGPAALEAVDRWFERATETITVGDTEDPFVYVLTDLCDPPREIMVGWSDGMWEHRAYWGEDLIANGTPGVGRFRTGDLPAPGQWTKLTIPAEKFNLAGRTINGMAFSVWGGKVWFDRAGVQPNDNSLSPLPPPMTSASSRLATLSTTSPRRYSFYTPELNLMAETDLTTTTPTIAYEYVWFGGQPVAQIESATGATSWYFNDHLGTPILQADNTGAVTWRVEYDPYGRVFAQRAGAGKRQPLRFPGQENDGTTDVSYNIFRWYRARWGRYTQADRVVSQGADRVYMYAENSPLTAFDPYGLYTVTDSTYLVGIPEKQAFRNACILNPLEKAKGKFPAGACNHAGVTLQCGCECKNGVFVIDPIELFVVGKIIYFSGDFSKLPKANDPSVTDAISAIHHEWSEHIFPALATIDQAIVAKEGSQFLSYETCNSACATLRTNIQNKFHAAIKKTQEEEEAKYK